MATDLLALSSRFIDDGIYEGPGSVNRVTAELSEVDDGVAVVESFSHVIAVDTDAGLVLFDTTAPFLAKQVHTSLREWSQALVHTIVYTHGHIDHVGGARVFVDDAARRGLPVPRVVGHENVPARFDRYDLTNGYNAIINQRQFAPARGLAMSQPVWPRDWVRPDTTFRDTLDVQIGDLGIELRHARGETDDHAWAWIPDRRTIITGDFVTWVFPNAGNPQKVQRYPREWAVALRDMALLHPELLLPAHGLPIAGVDRIRTVLTDVADALDAIVEQTLAMMNEGERLDAIVRAVTVPPHLLEKPYLRPVYDEPEFVVRNVWRLYGGWYDGNPARLKPARDALVATELATLAGGADVLARRAEELAGEDRLRLACHLAELAVQAEPENGAAHAVRAAVYAQRRHEELSLMAKGIYAAAAAESEEAASSS